MNRNVILRYVNVLLMLAGVAQMASGYALGEREWVGEAHEIGAVVLMALVLAHVALNWNWVRANYFRRKPAKPAPPAA